MPIEFFLPDRLVKQLLTNYNEMQDNKNKGLLFTVDFLQDESTHIYGATGTVKISAGDIYFQSVVEHEMASPSFGLCPHPPPCG